MPCRTLKEQTFVRQLIQKVNIFNFVIFKTIKEVKTGAATSTSSQNGMIYTCSSTSEVAVAPDEGPSLVIPGPLESGIHSSGQVAAHISIIPGGYAHCSTHHHAVLSAHK